ncbi:ABC transporter permease [Arcticibacter sp. MXS-1]|uniref:ABC transporter permease n=1 Tax=Arcticibacter sp. MXS-1 TaxID=3341726 RepID=UPI0035A94B8F
MLIYAFGIRKVLGASVLRIVILISRDFLRLVILAMIIAVPLCVVVMNQWLNGFAYRISISPFVFVITAALTLLIAFAAVGWQSFRAALANQVKSIRNE